MVFLKYRTSRPVTLERYRSLRINTILGGGGGGGGGGRCVLILYTGYKHQIMPFSLKNITTDINLTYFYVNIF